MTSSNQPTSVNPIYDRCAADLDRLRRRRAGDWSDFEYRFTLTESEERYFRAKCEEWQLDFDEQWRTFNDSAEPSQAGTPAARKAEEEWHPNRTSDHFHAFTGWLRVHHIMKTMP